MKKKLLIIIGVFVPILVFLSCGPKKPNTFVRLAEPGWAYVEVRDDLTYDEAWGKVVDIVAKRFDIETALKPEGYLLAKWLDTWAKAGITTEYYRVRVTIKFSPDKKKIGIKSEANFKPGKGNEWVLGSDELLLSTLKADIMGVVGRTSR